MVKIKYPRYSSHPYLIYVKNPNLYGESSYGKSKTNNMGFVGTRDTQLEKTKKRVICIGGSTTEMAWQEPDNTYPNWLEMFLGDEWEVINAGVAGWTSAEMLINLELRLLEFKPDYIVIRAGVNDAETGMFKNFKTDYSHARAPFGYTKDKESDLLKSIRPEGAKKKYERVPKIAIDTFKRNIRSMVAVCDFNGIVPIIVKENIKRNYKYDDVFVEACERNAEAVKHIAYYVETDLLDDDYMDGCHLVTSGMQKVAKDIAKEICKIDVKF